MYYLIVLFAICVIALIIDVGMTKKDTYISTKDQRILNILTGSVIIYFVGFRNMGGTDFSVYSLVYSYSPKFENFFEQYDFLEDQYYLFGMDKGYIFINSIIKSLGFTFFGFNLVHSVFCIGLMYFATRKYTNNYSVVIMIVLYKMFFYDFCVSLRQTITIAIFFAMLKDMEKKHFLRYFLLCFFCYWVHAASIVLFVLYFLRYLKLSKKTIIVLNVIFIPTLALSVFNVPILKIFDVILSWDIFGTENIADKAYNLIEGTAESGINWLHTIEYFLIMFLLITFYDDIASEFPNSDIMIKLFLCLLPIFTLFRNYEILTRWKDYFTISYGFILSYLAGIKNHKYRVEVLLISVLWCGFGFFRFMILFDNGAFMRYMPLRKYVRIFTKI